MAKSMNDLLNQVQERCNQLEQENADLKAALPPGQYTVLELAESSVFRISALVYLAALLPHGEHDLFDAVNSDVDGVFQALFPGEAESLDDDADMGWLLVDRLNQQRKFGFLACIETPFFTGATAYSWGRYHMQWLYGDTMNDIVNQAIEFCAEKRKSAVEDGDS